MKKIYLDYAATTPVDSKVLKAMRPYFNLKFGNAGSLHGFGQEAIAGVDFARSVLAETVGAGFRDIIFTGSATEANNLALRGVVSALRPFLRAGEKPKIITTGIEHESVLETCRDLEKQGAEIIHLKVSKGGIVDLKEFEKQLDEKTILVTIGFANNEMGAIQPLKEISGILNDFKKKSGLKSGGSLPASLPAGAFGRGRWQAGLPADRQGSQIRSSLLSLPLFHSDAVQAFQFLDCDVQALGLDLMTLSAHKIYGPKGIGALYVRRFGKTSDAAPLLPIITGGGQEYGFRSGTENVPYIVGFGKAAGLASVNRAKEYVRVLNLSQRLFTGLKKIFPKTELNGPETGSRQRLPNNVNVFLPGQEAQFFLTRLDLAGVAASAGSACKARSLESSYILKALGYNEKRGRQSIRFSLGRLTRAKEIDEALKRIKSLIT